MNHNIDNICIYRLIEDSVALSFRIFVLTIVCNSLPGLALGLQPWLNKGCGGN